MLKQLGRRIFTERNTSIEKKKKQQQKEEEKWIGFILSVDGNRHCEQEISCGASLKCKLMFRMRSRSYISLIRMPHYKHGLMSFFCCCCCWSKCLFVIQIKIYRMHIKRWRWWFFALSLPSNVSVAEFLIWKTELGKNKVNYLEH